MKKKTHRTVRAANLLTVSIIGLAGGGAPALAGVVTPQPRMGDPLPGLTVAELARFVTGKASFDHDFSVPEGLGPIFNQDGCGSCHTNPLGGTGTITVTRAGLADKSGFDPLVEFGGPLFQQEAITEECRELSPPPIANFVIHRVTNGMLGYGLVQAIPDADLYALEDPDDTNLDGISGRVQRVEAIEAPGIERAGRFGWKAQLPTMLSFSADASKEELGITNPLLPVENDPNGINPPDNGDPDFCDMVADPEEDMAFLMELADFQRFLAQPPQTPKSGMSGEAVFVAVGCAKCHVQQFTTSSDPLLEDAIEGQIIQPYSDFLMHNMGLNADGFPSGIVLDDGDALEMKTPPLWGVNRRDPVWHDGRFGGGTFEERMGLAIAAHDDGVISEGIESAQAYADLAKTNPEQQAQLLAFLKSLGRREFDHDGNDMVTLEDFLVFAGCYGGGPYTADDECAISDIEQDGDIDLGDFDSFLLVYEGPLDDCDGNTVIDLLDILLGADDLNGNGVLDECECLADIDNSGGVGITDLLDLLGAWGPNPGDPADIDFDGVVGITDLLDLLAHWGPC